MPPPWFFLPCFAVFFACCGAQFWFAWRLRRTLVDRHPEVWLRLSRSANMFQMFPELMFAFRRQDRKLADPVLTKIVVQFKWLHMVAITAWVGCAASMFFRS